MVFGEVRLVLLGLLLLHLLGILGHDAALDVALKGLRVQRLVLQVVPSVALVAVRDVQAAIHGALERGEHARASGRAHQAGVKVTLERTALTLSLDVVVLSDVLGVALVRLREVVLGQQTARAQQAGGVGSGVVGQAGLHAELGQLVRVRGADRDVTGDGGVDHLADHIAVGEAHGEAVLGGVVLVLVLQRQALAGIVVRLADATACELDLKPLEVRGGLQGRVGPLLGLALPHLGVQV
mmetsp:Transcript_23504/g.37722  ORF Transcript_23504/g.37722 Transcript_23504/m.37722 type:complete len:239 (-) Transcript_23504:13-729(-)